MSNAREFLTDEQGNPRTVLYWATRGSCGEETRTISTFDADQLAEALQEAEDTPGVEGLELWAQSPEEQEEGEYGELLSHWAMDPRIRIELSFGTDECEEEVFHFDTIEEANAFMMGIDFSNGWLSYKVLFDGREKAQKADLAEARSSGWAKRLRGE